MREPGSGLAALVDGSTDGLDRFVAGEAALCGLHLREDQGWNLQTVQLRALSGVAPIGWAKRQQGLILTANLAESEGIQVLHGKRVAFR